MASSEQTEAKVTPEQKAKNDANEIHKTLHSKDAATAYELMLKEISEAKTTFKPETKEFGSYRDALTKELQTSKDSIELSDIWGQRLIQTKVTNPNGERTGTISQRDLSPYANGALPTDGLTKMFASTLREQIANNGSVTVDDLGQLAKGHETSRNQQTAMDLQRNQTKGYAEQLEAKTSNGQSLIKLADIIGAGNNPEHAEGSVNKSDIDKLIAAGKDGQVKLKDSEIATLQYFSDNWDKPEIKNLRQTRSADGVVVDGEYISADSLAFAKRPSEEIVKASSEQAAVDNLDTSKIEAKANADLFSHKTLDTGKTLFEAADYFGGNKDNMIDAGDINKLIEKAKSGAVKISDADLKSLEKISAGYNSDPQVLALRQDSSYDETGNPIKVTGSFITPESLNLANGEYEKSLQKQNAEQSQRLDQSSVAIRKEAAEYANQLNTLKLGKNNLFTAADIYGASKDGVVDQTQVEGKIDDGDLKKLASVLLISNGAESAEYKLVNKLITDWNTPQVKALRENGYISVESMKAVALS